MDLVWLVPIIVILSIVTYMMISKLSNVLITLLKLTCSMAISLAIIEYIFQNDAPLLTLALSYLYDSAIHPLVKRMMLQWLYH